jgi:hypothetical protein
MTSRILVAAMYAATAYPETITDAERERAVKYLDSTRAQVVEIASRLSDAQWRWKQAPERWSVAECVEHIAATEELVFERMMGALKEEPQPEKKAAAKGREELVVRAVPNRGTRVQAPEEVRPTGRWPRRDDQVRAYEKIRGVTLEFARTTQRDLRSHFYPHFILKDLDVYQWLLFLAAHNDRHLAQIREVMADPGFPK